MTPQSRSKTLALRLGLSPHATAQLVLTGVAAIWGATFFMIKDVTAQFPVTGFLALRFSLITLVMLPIAAGARRFPRRAEWGWGLLAGLCLTFGYVGQTFAMRLIDSGRTGFITGLYVVIVPFLALLLLRTRIQRRIWAGTALALGGLVLLGNAPGGAPAGDLLAFGCACAYALQILFVGQFPKDSDWRIMTVIQLGSVGVLSLILLPILAALHGCNGALCEALRPFTNPLPTEIPANVILAAAFTGLLASGLGFSAQIWAQRTLAPSEAALIYAMESPFAALFGVLFRGEVLTLGGLIGGGLIVSGAVLTSVNAATDPELETKPDLLEAAPHIAPDPTFIEVAAGIPNPSEAAD
jgi:drug/metabolite transporter (DMT)-like permease